jgi:hypothetical protein
MYLNVHFKNMGFVKKKKKGFVPKTKENYFLGPPTVVPGPQTDEIALK